MDKFKGLALWAAPPREPSTVPSWIAPRLERIHSRSPLRPPSARPSQSSSTPASNAADESNAPCSHQQQVLSLDGMPSMAELHTPRTPTIPPPIISDRCRDCDALRDSLAESQAAIVAKDEAMATLRKRLLLECESELVRLALAVAARVVGRELDDDPLLVAAWAREAIESLDGSSAIKIAISSDLAAVTDPSTRDHAFGGPVVVDATLAPRSAEVRGDPGRAPVDASSRIAAVAEALGVDSE